MRRRDPIPTLFSIPRWVPENLKPVTGRTYGVPGEHLIQTAAKAHRDLILTIIVSALVLGGSLVAALLGIRAIYLSDTPPAPARSWMIVIGIAWVVLYFNVKPIKRVRNLLSVRGRTLAGLKGEQRVAELLEELPPEYRIIHGVDITWPGHGGEDIDHVIVGPTGLILVDAKNYSGDLVLASNAIVHNNQNITKQLLDGTERRATHLATFLGWAAPVRKIVCFTGHARVSGRLGNVQFTDRAGLKNTITQGFKAVHQDVIKEVAEDTALLSPSATTVQPWRTTFNYLPPAKKRAHQLRALYWPATLLQFPVGAAAVGAGGVTAFNLFHAVMGTGREPLAPHRMLEGGALVTTAEALGPHIAYGGAFLLTAAAAGGLHFLSRKLHRNPQLMEPTMRAERAEGRTERLRATATVGPDGKPRANFTSHNTGSDKSGVRDVEELKRIFSQELILPEDTLEELVTVQMLLVDAEEYKREYGQELPYGIILHGPPGTGKTQIARTMARAAGFEFIAAKPSELRDMWVGESSKRIQELYNQAREKAPAVVFLDEMDAVASKRGAARDGAGQEANHAVNQLLQEIDGLVKHDQPILTIGATNLLDNIDDAVKSRLAYQILIDLPDLESREKMFRMFTEGPYAEKLVIPFIELARASEGMSGRDIRQALQLASQMAWPRKMNVTREIMARAFERVGHTYPLD